MADRFISRKFILFSVVLGVALLGWIYALLYKPDQLTTISTFIITLLGAYSGANISDNFVSAKYRAQQPDTAQPGGEKDAR